MTATEAAQQLIAAGFSWVFPDVVSAFRKLPAQLTIKHWVLRLRRYFGWTCYYGYF
jgi:hypothetical protein